MPELVKLYIKQIAVGFVLSAVFVALLLYFNVANLWHLVTSSGTGYLAAFLLFMFNGIVFAGVQFGITIMRMAEEDDADGGKKQNEPVLNEALVPVPVRTPPRGNAA